LKTPATLAATAGEHAVEEAGVTVRAAHEDDLAGVLALYAQPDLDNGQTLSLDRAREVFRRFADYPDYHLYVAELEGRIVGTFALLIMENLAHVGTPSGVVEDVVVSSLHRGAGIGRLMMAFARERCRERGCYKMALSSNLKRDAAHRFYDHLGFERHGYSFRINP
jgi:GNAT superfamily N-acetyltransferase